MITVAKHGIQKLKNSHTNFKGSTNDCMIDLYTMDSGYFLTLPLTYNNMFFIFNANGNLKHFKNTF